MLQTVPKQAEKYCQHYCYAERVKYPRYEFYPHFAMSVSQVVLHGIVARLQIVSQVYNRTERPVTDGVPYVQNRFVIYYKRVQAVVCFQIKFIGMYGVYIYRRLRKKRSC
jgi:hypothetical protein